MSTINYNLSEIKAVLLDVDGVLSSDTVPVTEHGPMRTANVKDAYVLQLAVKKGLIIGIITGGHSEVLAKSLSALGLTYIYMSASDKKKALADFLEKTQLSVNQIAYMGDDIPDYEVMCRIGLPCCPSDAAPEIMAVSKYISQRKGGDACCRDLIEQILKAQGLWMSDDEDFGW